MKNCNFLVIKAFKDAEKIINSNDYLTNFDLISLIRECYYYISLLELDKLSKKEIQLIINIISFFTNENDKRIKVIINNLRNELNNKPKDNYDNMSKEELIALLRNK